MKLTRRWIRTTCLTFTLLPVCLTLAAQGVSSPRQPRQPESSLIDQITSLLERDDSAGAEDLIRKNNKRLTQELNTVLDRIDRDFDELGRQKARSDILQEKFTQLNVELTHYEKIFQLHSKATGQQDFRTHFQAKRLRIDGAEHTTRADLLWDRQQYDEAIEGYREAIKKLQAATLLARAVRDQKLVASCLNNIGYAEIFSGNQAEGIRNYSEALKIAEQRNDPIYQGLYLLNVGTFYLYTVKAEESLRYSSQAAETTHKTGRKTWEANALLNLGSAYLALGRNEEAQSYLQKALLKAQEAKDRRSHGRTLFNLALTATRFEQWPEASRLMEETLQWYQDNQKVYSQAEQTVVEYQGLNFLIDIYKKLNQPEKTKYFSSRLSELRTKDPKKLAAYLADPHLNFYMWREFKRK
ncbi:MAG: tetratricopeptide repeat protein [Acidobacteria bacterium]|nr:tetratricopeptide repeat protein [Acidobacteriota bacterium]